MNKTNQRLTKDVALISDLKIYETIKGYNILINIKGSFVFHM